MIIIVRISISLYEYNSVCDPLDDYNSVYVLCSFVTPKYRKLSVPSLQAYTYTVRFGGDSLRYFDYIIWNLISMEFKCFNNTNAFKILIRKFP